MGSDPRRGVPMVLAGAGLVVVGGIGLALTAVGGGLWITFAPEPRPTYPNVAACHGYIETFNAAPCNVLVLDPAELCPEALDDAPCDLQGYYACLGAGVRCEGDYLDISGQEACVLPRCP